MAPRDCLPKALPVVLTWTLYILTSTPSHRPVSFPLVERPDSEMNAAGRNEMGR